MNLGINVNVCRRSYLHLIQLATDVATDGVTDVADVATDGVTDVADVATDRLTDVADVATDRLTDVADGLSVISVIHQLHQ